MANTCEYRVIVKGAKNACYAFVGSTPYMDYREIQYTEGTDENCTVRFDGNCKWAIDADGCSWKQEKITIPDNPEEALEKGWDLLGGKELSFQARSALLGVEVLCNSMDIDCGEFYPIYIHYNNGNNVDSYSDNVPKELCFSEYKIQAIDEGTLEEIAEVLDWDIEDVIEVLCVQEDIETILTELTDCGNEQAKELIEQLSELID